MKTASYSVRKGGGVMCALCPNACALSDNEWGACNAREAKGGVLYARSYGRVSALNADPIEKKPLRRFMPSTLTLSVGAPGCNLKCYYCQNHSLSRARPNDSIAYIPPDELAKMAVEMGFPSISYTYNEPFTNIEYVLETAALARAAGLKNIMVTNAYANVKPFEDALSLIDAMNIDVKSFSDDAHKKCTGGELSVVKSNVERAIGRIHVEITALMVPGLCGAADVERIARWLSELDRTVPLHITRYHPISPDMPAATPRQDMLEAAQKARLHLDDVFLGNI